MKASIISVGTELVTGQSLDTNSAWISAQLVRLGITIWNHQTVPDDLGPIELAIRRASRETALVIMTGGLGPTADDLTRGALSAALNQSLREDPEALASMRAFFKRWNRPMPDSNRVQAQIPLGCQAIPNDRGTAPGILCKRSETTIVALPGVPAEMKAIFASVVEPILEAGTSGQVTVVGRLHCFGTSEARIGEALADLMQRGRNPQVGTTASEAVISIRVLASAPTATEAEQLLENDLQLVRGRLGTAVFGQDDDTLQAVLGRALMAAGQTIATAESCTGGLLAKRLTDMPGSSAYFLRGFVTYANEAKCAELGVARELIAEYGAVSAEVAEAMAQGCRLAAGSDLAVSITGIAGPDGGTGEKPVGLVFIGLSAADGARVKRLLLGAHLSRAEIRDRAAKWALHLVRRRLLESGESKSRV